MLSKIKLPNSIGVKLIVAFIAVFLLTLLSVLVAVYAITRIDSSHTVLSNSSIPALVTASHLSKGSLSVIQGSTSMNFSTSIDELNEKTVSTITLTDELTENIKKLKALNTNSAIVNEIESYTNVLKKDVLQRSDLIREVLLKKNEISQNIDLMRKSVLSLTDLASLMKIEADIALTNRVTEISTFNNKPSENLINLSIEKEVYFLDVASNLISRLADLKKDVQSINIANTEEQVLSIQQNFDHALRNIIRTVVKLPDQKLKMKYSPYVSKLIEYGQDTPDIFQRKIETINLTEKLNLISKEKIKVTQALSNSVSTMAKEMENRTNAASVYLDNTISLSRNVLISIAVVALMFSLIIIWVFVYKNIVFNLGSLSRITKRLSKEDYNFDIDTSGNNEFSDLSSALDSLKEHSLKIKTFNRQLAHKSWQLQRSNEDLTQFAYVASHDLQEPLRMVGSYVQLLEKRYKGELDEDADKFINYAVEGCLRMQALIEGLLKFSRVESSKEEMENIETRKILEDVLNDLSIRIKERNARIRIDWYDMLMVFAVPSQLLTVFSNIISNSIKYCVDRDPDIHIRAENKNDFIQFSIKDNGIGIDEQYQKKIFVIFKRLHSRDEFSGTGIGLSICKKIVERHGGKIWINSKQAEGSTFYFTFPSAQNKNENIEQKIAV